jgi:NTE family protein
VRKIALVLGGGGARGLAHVHALMALDDLGVRPALIVGTSIGSIFGAGYAAGLSGARIRNHVLETLGDRRQVLGRLWRLWPDSWREAFANGLPRIGEVNAERTLRAFMPPEIPETFEELVLPLRVTATDFYTGNLSELDHGPLFPAIAASIAIPGLFRPVSINGRVHVDGGIASAVSFELARLPEHIVVAVDVVGMPVGDPARVPSRIEAALGASQLMMQAMTRLKLAQWHPDVLIRAPVDGFGVLDFLRARRIIEHTAIVRDELRRKLQPLLVAA